LSFLLTFGLDSWCLVVQAKCKGSELNHSMGILSGGRGKGRGFSKLGGLVARARAMPGLDDLNDRGHWLAMHSWWRPWFGGFGQGRVLFNGKEYATKTIFGITRIQPAPKPHKQKISGIARFQRRLKYWGVDGESRREWFKKRLAEYLRPSQDRRLMDMRKDGRLDLARGLARKKKLAPVGRGGGKKW
jgi:hypothetical protein